MCMFRNMYGDAVRRYASVAHHMDKLLLDASDVQDLPASLFKLKCWAGPFQWLPWTSCRSQWLLYNLTKTSGDWDHLRTKNVFLRILTKKKFMHKKCFFENSQKKMLFREFSIKTHFCFWELFLRILKKKIFCFENSQ